MQKEGIRDNTTTDHGLQDRRPEVRERKPHISRECFRSWALKLFRRFEQGGKSNQDQEDKHCTSPHGLNYPDCRRERTFLRAWFRGRHLSAGGDKPGE